VLFLFLDATLDPGALFLESRRATIVRVMGRSERLLRLFNRLFAPLASLSFCCLGAGRVPLSLFLSRLVLPRSVSLGGYLGCGGFRGLGFNGLRLAGLGLWREFRLGGPALLAVS
jgi:hypothetical protein